MPTDETTEQSVLLEAAEHSDASPEAIAASVDATPEEVRDVLDRREVDDEVEAVADTDWDDPERCPFCGTALADGGAGFIDHIEETSDCERRFAEWREAIAGDVSGEWGG